MAKKALTAAGRRNTQLLAVFRYRATGDLHPFGFQDHHELLIGKWFARLLSRNRLANNILYTDGRHRITLKRLKSAMEEEFKFEDPLRCINIFVCSYSTHSRFMHTNIISHVFKDKGFQIR